MKSSGTEYQRTMGQPQGCNIDIMRVAEGTEREKGVKVIFEAVITENLPFARHQTIDR